jgi:hypothetical protein
MRLVLTVRSASVLRPVLGAAGTTLAMLLAGCAELQAGLTPPVAEVRHVPANHLGEPKLPADIRRVVLLPVQGGALVAPESLATLDPLFAEALQRQMRFEVVPVSRAWCRRVFGQEEFSSTEALPHNFLAVIGREHAADAVLFVDVTAYRDFRPLAIGVRAKLATVADTRLVWSYDEILSGADEGVANSARQHARSGDRSDLPVSLSPSVLQSPSRFAAYVADTVFGTLPPR